MEIFQGQGALWFRVWQSKAVLDVSLGLERVECEVHADAHQPGIHPLFHFIICRILENKLCEHKLSPNQTGKYIWDIPKGAHT